MTIFFCVIVGIFIIATILIRFSTFKIDINELEIFNGKIKKFKVILSLNLFNRIKWLKLTIDKKKIDELKNNSKTSVLNKILNTEILKDYKNTGKNLLRNWEKINKFEIEKFNLQAKIGTEDALTTAYLVGSISAILAIILARKINKPQYNIYPLYTGKNYIFLSINCIFTIKLVHIININKELKRKEVHQKYGRTSNRRTYANSHG